MLKEKFKIKIASAIRLRHNRRMQEHNNLAIFELKQTKTAKALCDSWENLNILYTELKKFMASQYT